MTAHVELTAQLKKLVLKVEDDLRERLASDAVAEARWREEHRGALKAERTAGAWESFRDDKITQVAVSWVLTTVFVRFCEDNRLLEPVWIAGPRSRRQEALDAELGYFRRYPTETSREWLWQAVRHLEQVPATAGLVDEYAPLRQLAISGDMATEILKSWRQSDEHGELRFDFADPELSTRFLGDLYQDLSEHAKKTYALLQTPVFVEEFILDQTLTPALAERPLEGFRLIDPTCGSGHFLLGAFERFLAAWEAESPGMEAGERVRRALASVHGVDINPFAVAIARFRLIVAALHVLELTSLEGAPEFELNLAAGDSLLPWNEPALQLDGDDEHLFSTSLEDEQKLYELLRPGTYDVVVGNPPYITVKDKALNQQYRAIYKSCHRKYALTVPFMERFFQLAHADLTDQPSGWVGQITSNSFMKREFGSKVIENVLSGTDPLNPVDLSLVIDTSGAYIPGHGTPTVILVGRRRKPVGETVRAVLGKRGEPGQPADPATGLVWTEITRFVDEPGHDGAYVTVTDLDRAVLSKHPWSLSGGGASDLQQALDGRAAGMLAEKTKALGVMGMTNIDDVFLAPRDAFTRRGVESEVVRPLVTGDIVRDYSIADGDSVFFPYIARELIDIQDYPGAYSWVWPARTEAWNRATFAKLTYRQEGRTWWEWHQIGLDRVDGPVITFAEVATHNHFVLDRGGKVFKQTAPIIKLPAKATEEEHLRLLGVLNSSIACFWLKQNSHNKGSTVDTKGARQTQAAWENFYQYNGTTVKDFPLPPLLPLSRALELDRLATQAAEAMPGVLEHVPTSGLLDDAQRTVESHRRRMIALQEELDWEAYGLYWLLDAPPLYTDPPEVRLGERAFEIVLARKVAAGTEETAWFDRHGSTPVTEIPADWPEAYREVVQARIKVIESDRFIGLLERPEFKRRWASESWEKRQDRALRGWILDRLEDPGYWFDRDHRPVPRSVAQLSDLVGKDADLVSVIGLWEGRPDVALSDSLAKLMVDEAVPYLAAYRLKESGMRKFAVWQRTWALQRREDAGEDAGVIAVPPKYTSADFRKASWWQARGKLDVPKERFILYPDANRAGDSSALLGWAGWDHLQQALALGTLYTARQGEGAETKTLVPLVAGMAELQPWVEQWHNQTDPEFGVNMAEYTGELLRTAAQEVGNTRNQLSDWRPSASIRKRRPSANTGTLIRDRST